jgi:plastocyanin
MIRKSSWLAALGVAGLISATGLFHASIQASSPAPAPSQDAYGTIKGRLVWGGAEIPRPVPITANKDKDPQVCAKEPLFDRELVVDAETKGVADAFAYLPAPKGTNPEAVKAILAANPKVELDQINCEFIPTSLAVHKDQPVNFKSSDAVGHNVHYSGFTNNANFALGPNGAAEKKLAFEKRPINLVCDIHPWMKGNIMVFNHPFYAVTGKDGSFEIKGVPPGTQNLIVWQRKAGYVTEGGSRGLAVAVKAGETTDLGEIKLDPAKVKK